MPIFSNPKPLFEINKLLDIPIAGYEKERLMLFCLAMSHKFRNPEDRAHVAVVGPSSEGKSWLVNYTMKLFDIIWEPMVYDFKKSKKGKNNYRKFYEAHSGISLTGVSKEVLKRWDFPYDNRILVLTELDAATMAMSYIRQLMSEGGAVSLTTEKLSSGLNYPVLWVVQGKAVWIATTASEELEHQFSNRVSLIFLNPADRRKIMQKIAEVEGRRLEFAEKMKVFEPVKEEIKDFPFSNGVIVPYGNRLGDIWDCTVADQNRIFKDFLRLIKCVALIHGRNVACGDDYEISRIIFCAQKLKLSSSLLHVVYAMREAFAEGRKYYRKPKDELEELPCLIRDELSEVTGLDTDTLRQYLPELQKRRIVRQFYRFEKDNYGMPLRRADSFYALTDFGQAGFNLPSFRELMGSDFKSEMFVAPYNPITGENLEV